MLKTAVLLLLLAGLTAVYANQYEHIRCQSTIGGNCGDSTRPREMNCCDYGYCQPWNAGYYQCIDKPAQCPVQETDVDYVGHDLETVYGVQPEACCAICFNTTNCGAYTFVNENPDGKTACYLKTSAIGWVEKTGAVSAKLVRQALPDQCSNQEINVDYFGHDLKSVANSTEAECCTTCSATVGCRFYTFDSSDETCYLKDSNAGRVEKMGVVSARASVLAPYATCPYVAWDTDYYGHDLVNFRDLTSGQCCEKCSNTTACVATTFVDNSGDGKSTCYLKSSTEGSSYKKGAFSAEFPCSSKTWDSCGSLTAGKLCCPKTDFCQPWNPGYYQCVPLPDTGTCSNVEVGVDFYGGDLKTVKDLVVSSCCDACSGEPQCVAFTFVNDNSDGHSACYLKKSLGERRAADGAVSGQKVFVSAPATTVPVTVTV